LISGQNNAENIIDSIQQLTSLPNLNNATTEQAEEQQIMQSMKGEGPQDTEAHPLINM